MATILVSVAVVGALGGIRALQGSEAKAKTADLLQNLAAEKLNDMRYLADPSDNGDAGDFSDRGYPDIHWTADIETSDVDNVDSVTVTVTQGKEAQTIKTMMFVTPQSSSTSGSGAAAP